MHTLFSYGIVIFIKILNYCASIVICLLGAVGLVLFYIAIILVFAIMLIVGISLSLLQALLQQFK